MSPDITVRPARKEDLPTLYTFEQGIVQAERPFDGTLREGQIHYYDLAALIVSPEACVLVAEKKGEVVGSGFARIRSSKDYVQHERHAYLGFMYVAPSHRGLGVNGRIIEGLIDWAKQKGLHEIQLDVYAENHTALRAYEKLGFRPNLLEMRLDTRHK